MLGLIAAWLHPALPGLPLMAQAQPLASVSGWLDAYIDVLLPADAVSPAASSLGVGHAIWDLTTEQPLLATLILQVGEWLNGSSAGAFVDLSPQDQIAIVSYMERADIDHLEGRFYQLIRLLAIEFYYADANALAGLELAATPQPAGYPPPWA